jgi:hypothetical protein
MSGNKFEKPNGGEEERSLTREEMAESEVGRTVKERVVGIFNIEDLDMVQEYQNKANAFQRRLRAELGEDTVEGCYLYHVMLGGQDPRPEIEIEILDFEEEENSIVGFIDRAYRKYVGGESIESLDVGRKEEAPM